MVAVDLLFSFLSVEIYLHTTKRMYLICNLANWTLSYCIVKYDTLFRSGHGRNWANDIGNLGNKEYQQKKHADEVMDNSMYLIRTIQEFRLGVAHS